MRVLVEVKSVEQSTHVLGEPYHNESNMIKALRIKRVVIYINGKARDACALNYAPEHAEIICYNEWLRRGACKE